MSEADFRIGYLDTNNIWNTVLHARFQRYRKMHGLQSAMWDFTLRCTLATGVGFLPTVIAPSCFGLVLVWCLQRYETQETRRLPVRLQHLGWLSGRKGEERGREERGGKERRGWREGRRWPVNSLGMPAQATVPDTQHFNYPPWLSPDLLSWGR